MASNRAVVYVGFGVEPRHRRGYAQVDAGAPKKFVFDPHNMLRKAVSAGRGFPARPADSDSVLSGSLHQSRR